MKLFKIIIICFVFIVLLLNVFPEFKIKTISFNPDSIYPVDNILDNPLNDEIPKHYDVEIGKDGEYFVLYSYNQLYCNEYGMKCENYILNPTKISKFDEHFNELRSIGGYRANELNIVHNNIFYAPFNLAQLDNGNIVAFGKAVDLEYEILYPSIFVMNSDLEIIDSIFLDITNYQYKNNASGHEYFEVIGTDDSGFTVKYTDIFRGSVLIHFNNDLEEEWSIKYDDTVSGGMYIGVHLAQYNDTLFYTNETYYVVVQELLIDYEKDYTIYSYDKDGNLKWQESYDFYISDVSVIEDDIIISGWDITSLLQTKNLLFEDEQQLIKSNVTAKINPENGSIEWKRNYYYKTSLNFNFDITNTVKDNDGNYYSICQDIRYDDLPYNILILKYDKSGDYVGESLLKGSYNSYSDIDIMRKTDIRLIDNTIQILTPTTSIYREINLDDISFSDTMPISFNPSFYNTVITIRLFLNRLTLFIVISALGFVSIRKYRMKAK